MLDDTTPEAREAQFAVWRRMGGARTFELAVHMSDEVRQLTFEGLRAQHPDWGLRRAWLEVYRMTLGDDLFHAAFGSELEAPRRSERGQ